MRRILWIVSLGALALLVAAPGARAVGLGFYGGGGGGAVTWTVEDDFGNEQDEDADTSHGTFGFVLDTAVARNTLFNYRLQIGYDRFVSEFDHGMADWELNGLVIDNSFGFALVRTPVVRLWLGPQLRLAGYTGHPEDFDDVDITVGAIGLGPVIGLNLNFGSVVTLAFDGGFRWNFYGGTVEEDYAGGDDYDVSGPEGMLFLNAGLIFRIGDTF